MSRAGRMGQGPAVAGSLYLATCNLLLCHAQATDQTQTKPNSQPARAQDLPGALRWRGASFFFFCPLFFSAPQPVDGMEICEVVAGRDHPRQSGPVMCCGSLLSPNSRIARPAWAAATSGALLGT